MTTMNNATRRVATLVVLTFALRNSLHGQTPTTKTHCTRSGDDVDCTSTDNSAQIARQAEQDREGYETGQAMGKALGRGILSMREAHQVKEYCKQHPGEVWTRTSNADGHILATGQCKGEEQYIPTVSNEPASGDSCSRLPAGANGCKGGKTVEAYVPKQLDATTQAAIDERNRLAAITQNGAAAKEELTKEKLVEAANSSFRAEKVVGYAESSGDTFTMHAERASDMRFHMMLADKQGLESYRTAGIKTLVYTNDAEQKYVYDLVAGHVVTPRVPTPRETYCRQYPRGSFREDDGSLEYCDVRDDPANQVSAAKPVPTATTATNAAKHLGTAGSSRTVTKAVDTPKPCFTDKLGHTVCWAQH